MFERFTQEAKTAVVLAQEEARLLQHNYIGTEHLLLGLLRLEDGVAADALRDAGFTLDAIRQRLGDMIDVGAVPISGQIPFTPRAKKVMEHALRSALEMQHKHIAPEHLLLGLLYEGEGVAAQMLSPSGTGKEVHALIEDVRARLGAEPTPEFGRRRFRGRRARMPEDAAPPLAPFCPRCNSPLHASGRYKMLEFAEGGGGPARTFAVPYCAHCGVALGSAQPDG